MDARVAAFWDVPRVPYTPEPPEYDDDGTPYPLRLPRFVLPPELDKNNGKRLPFTLLGGDGVPTVKDGDTSPRVDGAASPDTVTDSEIAAFLAAPYPEDGSSTADEASLVASTALAADDARRSELLRHKEAPEQSQTEAGQQVGRGLLAVAVNSAPSSHVPFHGLLAVPEVPEQQNLAAISGAKALGTAPGAFVGTSPGRSFVKRTPSASSTTTHGSGSRSKTGSLKRNVSTETSTSLPTIWPPHPPTARAALQAAYDVSQLSSLMEKSPV